MNIVTRFAPSPTGYLHLGNIRTALYSWLFARVNNGKFFIRIEDTDINKCNQKYIDNIFFVLDWLGLYWDNKPYYQSKKINLYKKNINFLLKNNLAYKCYCSVDRLNKIRNKCILNNLKPKYDGFCKNNLKILNNSKYVVRFKNSLEKNIFFKDEIFGLINIKNKELDDFIIQRSNGFPTYNFCVVIDDNNMCISHIIRGSDHINNTFKQINILKSLKFNIPKYVHLPLILDKNKKKLSKSKSCFSLNINNYINDGYLPEALINYLLKLGWSYKNIELISINNINNKLFNFKNINKSFCIYDNKKLIWINKFYIKNIKYDKLFYYLKPFFMKEKVNIKDIDNIYEIIYLIINRISFLKEIVDFYLLINRKFLLKKKILVKYDLIFIKKVTKYYLYNINNIILWSLYNIKLLINNSIKNLDYSKKYIFPFLRYLLIGNEIGIDLYILVFILKKEKVLYKLNNFVLKKIFKFFYI